MDSDSKAPAATNPTSLQREKGIKIFMYPKIVFLFPTLITSLTCWIGMWMAGRHQRRRS